MAADRVDEALLEAPIGEGRDLGAEDTLAVVRRDEAVRPEVPLQRQDAEPVGAEDGRPPVERRPERGRARRRLERRVDLRGAQLVAEAGRDVLGEVVVEVVAARQGRGRRGVAPARREERVHVRRDVRRALDEPADREVGHRERRAEDLHGSARRVEVVGEEVVAGQARVALARAVHGRRVVRLARDLGGVRHAAVRDDPVAARDDEILDHRVARAERGHELADRVAHDVRLGDAELPFGRPQVGHPELGVRVAGEVDDDALHVPVRREAVERREEGRLLGRCRRGRERGTVREDERVRVRRERQRVGRRRPRDEEVLRHRAGA